MKNSPMKNLPMEDFTLARSITFSFYFLMEINKYCKENGLTRSKFINLAAIEYLNKRAK